MGIKNFRIFIFLFFIFLSDLCFATPDEFRNRREVFIGSNEKFYYTFVSIYCGLGSIGSSIDSLFLCKYSLLEGKIIKKIKLRIVKYEYNYDKGILERFELIDPPKNPLEYLIKDDIIFNHPTSHYYEFKILKDGLFIVRDSINIKIMDESRLNDFISIPEINLSNWFKELENFEIVSVFDRNDYIFLHISFSIRNCYDASNKQESIIPLISKDIQNTY